MYIMNPKFKKPYRRAGKRGAAKSKRNSVKTIVKRMLNKNIETKTVNVPDPATGTTNTVNYQYVAGQGIHFLGNDIFKLPQGVDDSTLLVSPNRLGDRVTGVGFLMDYYFTLNTGYSIGPAAYVIPFVKLRITVWKQAFGTPLLTSPLLYDSNFLVANTSTLQPINWDEGYVKDVLYDKTFLIKQNFQSTAWNGAGNILPINTCFHFKKYIPYKALIKYADNNTLNPNGTDKPIYITMAAEMDDASGLMPSGTRLLTATGYTRGWFKDA